MAQLKINCCGINQAIPVFKADDDFDDSLYKVLVARSILSPIRQSEADFEIRLTALNVVYTTIMQIKCSKNVMSVKRYTLTGTDKGILDIQKDYPDYTSLGYEGQKITHLVKIDDISDQYHKYDWNKFFSDLIADHLFDIPGGKSYLNAVLAKNPGAYPKGESLFFIEVKHDAQFRNLKYWGEYNDTVPSNPLIANQKKLFTAITSLFN